MKIRTLSLLLSFLWIPVTAQKFIPRAGLSLSTIQYNETNYDRQDESSKSGFVVAVAVDLPILKRLSIQPELSFVKKGVRQLYETPQLDVKSSYSLNYLELSILAKVRFDRFYFILGPTYGYGIGGTYVAEKWYDLPSPSVQYELEEMNVTFGSDISPNLNEFDEAFEASVALGLGYVLKGIQVDVRYVFGLTSIDANYDYTQAKNGVFQLTVGYPISIRAKKSQD